MVASATNPIPAICAAKLYEVQKHMTLTNHQYNPQSVVVSKKFWDTLSADEKKILRDTAQESAKCEREQARGVGLEHASHDGRAGEAAKASNRRQHAQGLARYPPSGATASPGTRVDFLPG